MVLTKSSSGIHIFRAAKRDRAPSFLLEFWCENFRSVLREVDDRTSKILSPDKEEVSQSTIEVRRRSSPELSAEEHLAVG